VIFFYDSKSISALTIVKSVIKLLANAISAFKGIYLIQLWENVLDAQISNAMSVNSETYSIVWNAPEVMMRMKEFVSTVSLTAKTAKDRTNFASSAKIGGSLIRAEFARVAAHHVLRVHLQLFAPSVKMGSINL
jgi:hypothetical protein